MNETITSARNTISHSIYKGVFKPLFFRRDPEEVHDALLGFGKKLGNSQFGRICTRIAFDYHHPSLEQDILGIHFKNPIGLSAGFDKNAEITDIIPSVGFGFTEIGSVTGEPCEGNAKPRLWRLPKSQSLLVYYGLKNDGCEVVAQRLLNKKCAIPIGASIAMTNCRTTAENLSNAVADYVKAFQTMEPVSAYLTINISCPNAFGGQPFTTPDRLEALLCAIDAVKTKKPIFIKLSPDLDQKTLDMILSIARVHHIDGIICSNLTKKRENNRIIEKDLPTVGGLSGKVVQDLADAMLAYIYRKEGKRFVLIGSGGISSAEDAYKKIRLGASLLQLITGMIYEGPSIISSINQGLVRLLTRDGFHHLSEAVGVDAFPSSYA